MDPTEIERYRQVLDAAFDGIWDWDLPADRIYLNDRYCELIGYTSGEITFDRDFLRKIAPSEDNQCTQSALEVFLLENKGASAIEHRLIAKNGSVRWVESRGKAVDFDRQGRPVRILGTMTDITSRIKTVDTLRHSHTLLTNFSQQVPGALFQTIITPDGHACTPYSSEKLLDIYEVSPAQIRENLDAIAERFHPEDRERIFASVADAAKNLTRWECEYRVILPRQGLKWLYGVADLQRMEDGTVYFYGIVMDITERKRTEITLAVALTEVQRFRKALDHLSAYVYMKDQDLRYIYANKPTLDLFGCSAAELVGCDDSCFFPPDTVASLREIDSRVLAGEQTAAEIDIGDVAGGRRVFWEVKTPIYADNGSGEIKGLCGISTDITERKSLEETLNHSRVLLSSILENAPSAFFVKDVRNDFRIIMWNRASERVFGIPASKMLGKTVSDSWPAELTAAYQTGDHEVVSSRMPLDIPEEPGSHPDKGTIYLHTRKIPLFDCNGDVSHIVVICDDITEQRMMLTEAIKSQKLESLGVLAGGIAHDFNNILTGITGNISLARSFLDVSHKSADLLHKAEKAAIRATDLANQLLTFAKGGAPVKKTVSLYQVLTESASFMLHGSNVSCKIEVPEDLPAVEVDEGQFHQVVNNLIINASQAMPGGGTVSIKATHVMVDTCNLLALVPGEYVRLEVSDTGCGIPNDSLDRIFDPYFTTKTGGSGLGLASAQSIITRHGGHIAVRSVVGEGTTFEILLPASTNKIDIEDDSESFQAGIEGQSFSILVMDDEDLIREIMQAMLIESGYHVQTCRNGEEAIQLYKAATDVGAPYSAVIMDLTIPGGMGGQEAAQQILKIDPQASLIVSSGYSTDPVMANHKAFGFCATLQKPYTLDEVSRILGNVLQRND
ncbi:MAG: PAS domain-containing protein [Geobacteraceae bacterium]|nr:PAS domain-containing protein [Geobacteraceae bacterium]